MVGRCSVCVCNQDGGNITEITNDKKQTFVCDLPDISLITGLCTPIFQKTDL